MQHHGHAIEVEPIREWIAGGDRQALQGALDSEHSADLARLVDALEPREGWAVLGLFPVQRQAEIFGYLDGAVQGELVQAERRGVVAAVVSRMSADERADLYNRLEAEQREALMPALAQAEREEIRRLASYGEETAGAVMTSEYAVLPMRLTAREAIDRLRREAPDKETIYQAYVLDDDRKLIGTVSLRDLILAPAGRLVGDLMTREVVCAQASEDQEEVAHRIAHYDLMALPVVDEQGRMVGIVTHDDAIDVLQQEATEDFHKAASVGQLPVAVPAASFRMLYRKRVGWLILLVFGNIFSGAGIAFFEETIQTWVALVFFLPLLIDSGGNAGSQAATLMVRALATGEVVMKDWWDMLGKELAVATALGITMAAAVSVVGVARGGPQIAMVVSLTMVCVVVAGSLIGMSLPFLLSRLDIDPATASAPLVTSIADATGVLVYFSIATAVLGVPG